MIAITTAYSWNLIMATPDDWGLIENSLGYRTEVEDLPEPLYIFG